MSVLVLVDWQNLFKACERRETPLEQVFEEIVRMAFERGTIEEIRLFVPNYQLIASPWRLLNTLQLKHGLAVEVCPVLREGAEMDKEGSKDVVDLSAYQWIAKHIYPGIGPEFVFFVSGDGHFIVAANEIRRRGKEVQFWVVDPDTTSNVIFKNVPVEIIKPREILIGVEENAFLLMLNKATTGKELDEQDNRRLACLRRVSELLSVPERPVTLEAKINEVIISLIQQLGIPEDDARQALKALIVAGVVRLYPATTHGLIIDSSSLLFQWLQTTGK